MICAVIPTRFHPPELARLLGVLASDGVCTHLVVAAQDSEDRLHEMWNDACDAAEAHGASSIAVLKDDIAILPGTLPLFASLLAGDPRLGVVHPDSAAADWNLPTGLPLLDRERPLSEACFMLHAAAGVRFDEPLHFDQQFDRDLRAAGWDIACVIGVPYRDAADCSTNRGRVGASTNR